MSKDDNLKENNIVESVNESESDVNERSNSEVLENDVIDSKKDEEAKDTDANIDNINETSSSDIGSSDDNNTKNNLTDSEEKKDLSIDSTSVEEKKQADLNAKMSAFSLPVIDNTDYIKEKKQKRKKVRNIVFCSLFSVVLLVYVVGVVFHYNRFGTNTYINNINISGKTIDEVEVILDKQMSEYSLTIDFQNGQEILSEKDGVISVRLEKTVKEIKNEKNYFLWFVDFFSEDYYNVAYVVDYDVDKLSEYVLGYDYFKGYNMQPAIDAKVELKDGDVVVTPAKMGTLMDKDKVINVVCSALDGYLNYVNLVESDCYIRANLSEDSDFISEAQKNAEKFLSLKCNIDFGDYQYQLTRDDLAMIGYIDNNGNVVINRRNVEVFARQFDERFGQVGKKRKFRTHDGRVILVQGDDYYGWVLDPEREAEELYDLLCKKVDFTKEVAYIRKGYAMCEMNDIGYDYVEVDLTKQKVFLYIDGKKIVESDCVTGNVNGFNTPGGLYGITYCATDATLKGPGYETKVTFWMPFNYDIGLHDAIWRADFGKDIYTYDGSHGCVNLPYDVAQTIFYNVEGEFPVVCYWDYEVTEVEE